MSAEDARARVLAEYRRRRHAHKPYVAMRGIADQAARAYMYAVIQGLPADGPLRDRELARFRAADGRLHRRDPPPQLPRRFPQGPARLLGLRADPFQPTFPCDPGGVVMTGIQVFLDSIAVAMLAVLVHLHRTRNYYADEQEAGWVSQLAAMNVRDVWDNAPLPERRDLRTERLAAAAKLRVERDRPSHRAAWVLLAVFGALAVVAVALWASR